MGALLAKDEVAAAFVPGTHASTFGGNPLACAAAITVLDEVLSDGFLERVTARGDYLRSRLEEVARRHEAVREVRGLGLMQAVDLAVPGTDFSTAMREEGVLVNCTSETVLRFLPPLIVSEPEIDRAVEILDLVLGGAKGR
jgi:acetylornithine/succinyldiaminopimelate/putrescine aminotransferase